MKTQSPTKILLASISLMAATIGFASAQTRTDESIMMDEARKAIQQLRAENLALKERNLTLETQGKVLRESLVDANRNIQTYRDDYNTLRLQIEALGLEALTKGEKGVEGNLLKAISDRRVLVKEREIMADALGELSDSTKLFMKTASSTDATARANVQAALKGASQAVGLTRVRPNQRKEKSLDDGKITTIERNFGVLVFNLGEIDGVKIGMPFEIYRKDRPIGTAIVADIRNDVCGALITKLIDESDDAQVGDRVKVQANTNL